MNKDFPIAYYQIVIAYVIERASILYRTVLYDMWTICTLQKSEQICLSFARLKAIMLSASEALSPD